MSSRAIVLVAVIVSSGVSAGLLFGWLVAVIRRCITLASAAALYRWHRARTAAAIGAFTLATISSLETA